ncbi:MAG: hypothetical protein KF817_00750 [Phycisphaeraceae bacterium]|nr:hypothetical protein [Phycisphaeraceae bacterium]
MSQLPPPSAMQGHAPPTVRQFSVFLENKVGRLHDLVRLFDEDPAVHLCSLSVIESSDHAVVRIIPSDASRAQELLRGHRCAFSVTDLLIVELSSDHTLTGLCLSLLGAELNIRFAYPLLRSSGDENPTIALAVDDHVLAGQILRRKNFRLLGEKDLE